MKHLRRAITFIGTAAVAVAMLACSSSRPADSEISGEEVEYVQICLPMGISLEVPSTWHVFTGEFNEWVEENAEKLWIEEHPELVDETKVNLLRANSTPETTYASVAVNIRSGTTDPSLVHLQTREDLECLAAEFASVIASVGMWEIIGTPVATVSAVGEIPALQMSYVRSGDSGPVQCTRIVAVLGHTDASIMLAYRQSEEELWRDVIAHIGSSFSIDWPY